MTAGPAVESSLPDRKGIHIIYENSDSLALRQKKKGNAFMCVFYLRSISGRRYAANISQAPRNSDTVTALATEQKYFSYEFSMRTRMRRNLPRSLTSERN
jgi:hypothetical protein